MKTVHHALVSLRIYSSENLQLFVSTLAALSEKGEILKVSSIFRVRTSIKAARYIHDLRNEGRFSGLCMVIKVQTALEPKEFLMLLQGLEKSLQAETQHRTVSLNLLTFDDFACMTPWMTLPHPEFHKRPEEIIPSAEIWGEYIHPILNESLRSLTKPFDQVNWGEFYAQGKSVLDF